MKQIDKLQTALGLKLAQPLQNELKALLQNRSQGLSESMVQRINCLQGMLDRLLHLHEISGDFERDLAHISIREFTDIVYILYTPGGIQKCEERIREEEWSKNYNRRNRWRDDRYKIHYPCVNYRELYRVLNL